MSNRIKIGIYVNSLTPSGASQARFQESLLAGLRQLGTGRYRFVLLAPEVPQGFEDDSTFSYIPLEVARPSELKWQKLSAKLARPLLTLCGLVGQSGSALATRLWKAMNPEPPYYRQLRDLNVRLIWNMNQHELKSWLPFIRTIWDINHRIHSMYPEWSYTRGTFEGLDANMANSLARASYVICGTEEGKRQVTSIYGVHDRKVRVIPFPTPVLPNPDGNARGADEGGSPQLYIFYPARFWPHKNHIVIVRALKILREKWNIVLRCKFSGAEEGNLRHVLNCATDLGVRDQVQYVGEVPDEDLVRLYKGAMALVYASAAGPDNLPPLEAMSFSCPVITAEVPGAREQFGDSVLFFDPMNEEELAGRIKELMDDGPLRQEMIRRGTARAASWTVLDYAMRILSIFDEFSLVARSWARNDSVFSVKCSAPLPSSVRYFRVNFMIIGAMKCGTSSLAEALARHPDVCMSTPKEPQFFSKSSDWRVGLDSYHDNFQNPGAKRIGEASTTYTCHPEFNVEVWNAIHDYNPEMQFIYIIRHPMERIISNYLHLREHGHSDLPFSEAIRKLPGILGRGRYWSQIRPYIEKFGRDKVLILRFEDFVRCQVKEVNKALWFMGLPEVDEADYRPIHSNRTGVQIDEKWDSLRRASLFRRLKQFLPVRARSFFWKRLAVASAKTVEKPLITAEDERFIYNELEPEILEIQKLTGWDLSSWLERKYK